MTTACNEDNSFTPPEDGSGEEEDSKDETLEAVAHVQATATAAQKQEDVGAQFAAFTAVSPAAAHYQAGCREGRVGALTVVFEAEGVDMVDVVMDLVG